MYQILLVSPDGQDYKIDCKQSESIEQAWERCNDLGSKWYFYPICFVVEDNGSLSLEQPIIDVVPLLNHLVGESVSTALADIAEHPEFVKVVLSY